MIVSKDGDTNRWTAKESTKRESSTTATTLRLPTLPPLIKELLLLLRLLLSILNRDILPMVRSQDRTNILRFVNPNRYSKKKRIQSQLPWRNTYKEKYAPFSCFSIPAARLSSDTAPNIISISSRLRPFVSGIHLPTPTRQYRLVTKKKERKRERRTTKTSTSQQY